MVLEGRELRHCNRMRRRGRESEKSSRNRRLRTRKNAPPHWQGTQLTVILFVPGSSKGQGAYCWLHWFPRRLVSSFFTPSRSFWIFCLENRPFCLATTPSSSLSARTSLHDAQNAEVPISPTTMVVMITDTTTKFLTTW
jgi:hypothetical protein